ncbi:MAG: HEAT repeat domain-containing protein [gamma proteobacterium symbiont of Lucinoma myriamae]|nr:HEAT repeat domain-containing protein [gamma proteobacterium symbiont of Lucinoma myriamae]MCU7818507.1 HEAT repeat domain-containing protein [gamma proteobacterium symbiont of Lucinoma myriamae]MCU7833503.1 HEAT repeat domain-containing protein [gamma proteobacterium symbiont of Lucinoma myriamae]
MQEYFNELLTTGELNKIISLLKKEPDLLRHLPAMIQDKDTPLGAKIGIGAIFEEFQGSKAIQALIPSLTELLNSEQANIRNDACYYLGLTESTEAIEPIKTLANDDAQEVRESVRDALDIINQSNSLI